MHSRVGTAIQVYGRKVLFGHCGDSGHNVSTSIYFY